MILSRRTLLAAASSLPLWPARADDAQAAFTTYERDSGGKIGAYAENMATAAKITWRADERIIMCSTFKASLAAFVLARTDHHQDSLEQMVPYGPADILDYAPVAKQNLARGAMSVAELCEGMVELSDNSCANLLLARVGGPAALTDFWRSIGDTITRLDHTEPELNRSPPGDPHDTTTPAAMAGTLRRLVLGDVLSPSSRDQLIGWMVDCKTGGKRLRGGLPKDWKIGDKTGNNGSDASSDVAVVWPRPGTPIVICAYTQGGSPTPAQLETVFAAIGRMAAERLA